MVEIQSELAEKSGTPECEQHRLMWGGRYEGGGTRSEFPYHEEIQVRYKSSDEDYRPFDTFETAVLRARRHVLVLDPFLSDARFGLRLIGTALAYSSAYDIRLLSKETDEPLLQELNEDRRDAQAAHDGVPGRIKWINGWGTQIPYAHDRFAIIDDELWHFGATVGGGHHGLNAASRGWQASEFRAIEYFNHIWEILRDESY